MLKRITVVSAVLAAVTACGTNGASSANDVASSSAGPAPSSVYASAESAAGIPPKPDAVTTAAYIDALTAIDPDIVQGKPDRAVSRGRDQCSSVHSSPNDQEKLINLTNQRFTSSNHPNGFGRDKSAQILAVVRKYLCP